LNKFNEYIQSNNIIIKEILIDKPKFNDYIKASEETKNELIDVAIKVRHPNID